MKCRKCKSHYTSGSCGRCNRLDHITKLNLEEFKPTLIDCNEISSTMKELKARFSSSRQLNTEDLSLTIDLIYSTQYCDYNDLNLNNVIVEYYLPNINSIEEVSNAINQLNLFEINENQIAYFNVGINNELHKFILKLGKGEYGIGSNNIVTNSDLILIFKSQSGSVVSPVEIVHNYNPNYPLVLHVPTSGQETTIEEIATFLSQRTITVDNTKLDIIKVYVKKNINGFSSIVEARYFFKRNYLSGIWGYGTANGGIVPSDLLFISEKIPTYSESDTDKLIDLGDIGGYDIVTYLNNTPQPLVGDNWNIDTNKNYWFKYTSNNVNIVDLYIGPTPVILGSQPGSDYSVVDADFQRISTDGIENPNNPKIIIEGIVFDYRPSPLNTSEQPMPGDIALNNFDNNNEYAHILELGVGDPSLFSSWFNPEDIEDNLSELPIFISMEEATMNLGVDKLFRYDSNNFDGVPSPKNSTITITKL